ncbi:hypothetical protein GCM10010123_12360 [Pilimelia anulata]|uniref:DUF6879 domain-containing protein n=1 Tax=Pilimelia anulata TaxID=53371 RepID=A0A8J3F6Y7_9ACTN|nr:DUF6879 family protein [Pilimelia anulata]GGJ84217.1 hypothetical protein GCM10010123_12360 [Pilimelia anulata]
MTGRPLTGDEFAVELAGIARSAFRLELQPAYDEPAEREPFARYLAGAPAAATGLPAARPWLSRVREQVAAGMTISRVRVHDEPPTAYQRWQRAVSAANVAAGERIDLAVRAAAR